MNPFRKLGKTASVLFLALAMAGCGGGGDDGAAEAERQALDTAQKAAMAAATAARASATAAAGAVAGVMADRSADPSSYALAQVAADNAEAAADAAEAANTSAQAATTSADAKKYQATAEAEQAKAAAQAMEASRYANMVAEAQQAIDDAATEMAALSAAQAAAMTAAGAAMKAATDAQAAVDALADSKDADLANYTRAQDAAAAAQMANEAAQAANEAAKAATTSADAQAQQAIAEKQQAAAEGHLADATMYANMVAAAHEEATALSGAMTAARTAATAARAAATEARMAADRVAELEGATSVGAMQADAAAEAAEKAAILAEDAADRADAAETSAAAVAEKEKAEAQRTVAESSRDAASTAKDLAEAGANEAKALADAKTAAMTAADMARTAADSAQTAADKVAELAGDDSTQAMEAQTAANRADMAAVAATTANTTAQNASMSADAIAARNTAQEQQEEAEKQLAKAQELQREAQFAYDTDKKQQEQRDIAAAQVLAIAAADNAQRQYTQAMQKAGDARMYANNADDVADKAMAARTDYANAKKYADMAATAAAAAAAAEAAAMTARDDADDARQSAIGATTVADAQMYRDDAQDANDIATMQNTTAGTKAMEAMEAADMAADYAMQHVLGLFKMANAYDVRINIDDPLSANLAKMRAAEIASIGTAIANTAEVTDGNQAGTGTTATAVWPVLDAGGDTTNGDPNTDTSDDVPGTLKITVNLGGAGSITSALMDSDAGTPADTTDDITKNASKIAGVSGFMHGFDMMVTSLDNDPDTMDDAQVIAFTDKKQRTAAVTAVPGKSVINAALGSGTVSKVGATSGNSIPGVEFTEGGDTNGAMMGTLNCASNTSCSILANDDGTYTVTGYTFTGSRAQVKGKTADSMNDYLIFGLWLRESGAEPSVDTFGAFGTGGEPFTATSVNALTGTASYSGPAVGAHHKTGMGVSWFEGVANLTAKFGTSAVAGKIGGTVSNIRVGGAAAMTDSIHLVETDVTTATNTFNGTAVMGAQSSAGRATHAYNGTWSGGFFNNPTIATGDTDTSDNYPGAVAGTFGVTKTDDMGTTTGANAMDDDVTESYVGAFGAKKQ